MSDAPDPRPGSRGIPARRTIIVFAFVGFALVAAILGGAVIVLDLRPAPVAPVAQRQVSAAVLARGRGLVLPVAQRVQAPSFRLQTASFGDGTVFDLRQEQGQVVVLFFFAGWCATCIPEARALKQLHDRYADDGVRILALDVDPRESETHIARFRSRADSGGYLWALEKGQLIAPYRVRQLDATVVIDRSGKIAYRDSAPTNYATLKAVIETLL